MTISTAFARWDGDVRSGTGFVSTGDGIGATIGYAARFEGTRGMTPEAMLGGALAACFSMAYAARLSDELGHAPRRVETSAEVALEGGDGNYSIDRIVLNVVVDADDLAEAEAARLADEVTRSCPIGKALASVHIEQAVSIGTAAR